ncbi:Do family serine endopeptidase [Gracilimonas tropica]|uniref:Do family serine endopeptidase n=1 Tax=Gracilimonas tropica TaxID=454600 RepID=UPI0003704BDC|nr:Do family serine endopeptidase [Gracilimonas tropica]
MNTFVKNTFGVAAALLVLLGLNFATTNKENVSLPNYDTEVTSAEARPVSSLKDFNDAIVDIAEKTNPSVVTITTKRTQEVRVIDPFARFFGNPRGEGETRERVQRGLGSGVIVSDEGYILTNNHVIEEADEIQVRLMSGDEVSAEVIGSDPQTDIAVLQIDVDDLPVVEMGNSDELKVGSLVLAIGSPLSEDLAHTVSFGIVSARGRSLNNLTFYGDYIQTDAAINPGNSGGALIDVNGQLVGINSAIASRSGGNDGIGFAIPINLAKRIMDDLIDDGEVSRGYLGITYKGEVDQTLARALGLDNVRGIIVGNVEEDSPADKAGLKEDDIIISLNDEKIRNWDSFRTQIAAFKPDDNVTLGIIRDDENMEVEVTLGKRAESIAQAVPQNSQELKERLGFDLQELNSDIRRQLNAPNDLEGIVVTEVQQSSNAYERGLRRGDVITSVQRKKISTVNEFYSAIEENDNEVVLLTVYRNNVEQYIAFEL